MDNQLKPNPVRPVLFLGAPGDAWLYYDADKQHVEMSTVKLADLSVSDFKRIHAFWRKVQQLKTGVGRNG